MSRFRLSAESGMMQAEIARTNIIEIEGVFDDLKHEVLRNSSMKVSLLRVGPSHIDAWTQSIDERNSNIEKGRLILKNIQGDEQEIAKWEQAVDGYPFTINYVGQRHDCWDEKSLVNILGEILSTGSFWLTVKSLASPT